MPTCEIEWFDERVLTTDDDPSMSVPQAELEQRSRDARLRLERVGRLLAPLLE